jgi:DNA-binding transcriptional ArsR family regulator
MALHPTLWRTCRILAGGTRLQLLRWVVAQPGKTVSDLALAVGISLPRASQELRRLQSRGLIQAVRVGKRVRYQPIPDPEVPSAALLLAATEPVFRRFSDVSASRFVEVASAFSHPRRIAIAQELLRGPRYSIALRRAVGVPKIAFNRHLKVLRARALVVRRKGKNHFAVNSHPLAKALARVIKQASLAG